MTLQSQFSPDQINDLRRQVLEGKEVSVEEYAAIITSYRQKRSGDVQAAHEAKAKRAPTTKEPKAPVELPDFFNDI